MLPAKNEDYASQTYWESRYNQDKDYYDWLSVDFNQLETYFDLRNAFDSSLLMLGCGNSKLSQHLFDAGYKNITNLDYSPTVIANMQQRNPAMQWIVGDVRALPFEDSHFDVVIDKATMDSMLAIKHDPWDPPPEVLDPCKQEVDEALRVLKPGGIFLVYTWGQPHFRRKILERPNATLTFVAVADTPYFVYRLCKHESR